jgi:toxin FitB
VIVLDTNVISEPLRRVSDPKVREWLNTQSPETLCTTAINVAERSPVLLVCRPADAGVNWASAYAPR